MQPSTEHQHRPKRLKLGAWKGMVKGAKFYYFRSISNPFSRYEGSKFKILEKKSMFEILNLYVVNDCKNEIVVMVNLSLKIVDICGFIIPN